MLENLEGLEYLSEARKEGFSSSQMEYLSELNVSDVDWAERNETQQTFTLSAIDGRMDELQIPIKERSEIAHEVLSDDIADAFDNYLETYNIEAPQDHIQIEQVSEVLSECDEIKYENWINLELSEKESVLNALEERIAEIECRPACPIRLAPLEERQWGGYNPVSKDITINSNYAECADFATYREIIDTLVHEGRHAYQDYNVTQNEIHPRHSEVASWAETMEGGKWGYWGDCSTFLGQRLYDQQSIEIDARNFAGDVLDKLNLNA
ncbi:MAG: hypothetical protein HDR86_04905 [Bacteroides sp.]|nr:hypothetical protein [Bacteroides sp.]